MKIGDLLLSEDEHNKKSWTAIVVKVRRDIHHPRFYYTLLWDDGAYEAMEDVYMGEGYYNFKILVRACVEKVQ